MTEELVQLVRHIMSQQIDTEQSTKSTQTKQIKQILYQFDIFNKKYITIYQSKKSKKNVFAINLDQKKKIIFDQLMWKKFKSHINLIDEFLGNK